MNKNKRGFTLIELLVVIAIIGLLASIVAVAVNSARKKARDVKRKADIKTIQTALEVYYDDNNSYPNSDLTAGNTIVDVKDMPTGSPNVDFNPYFSGGKIPTNPLPVATAEAAPAEYRYVTSAISGSQDYALLVCLETPVVASRCCYKKTTDFSMGTLWQGVNVAADDPPECSY